MRPAPFAYQRVGTVEAMLGALAGAGADDDVRLLAGGQSLLPALKRREARPGRLVDIDRVAELDHATLDGDGLRVGALRRHLALEEDGRLDGPWRALREAAGRIAMRPVRARGTFGGSLAEAHPAAELPLVAVTLEATVLVRSAAAAREVPADELLLAPHRTSLRPDEAIAEIRFPAPPPGARSTFVEVAERAIGWPVAAVCAAVADGPDGVTWARVGIGGAGPVPRRSAAAEAALTGRPLDAAAIADAGEAARADIGTAAEVARPGADDGHADLVATLVRRALERLGGER